MPSSKDERKARADFAEHYGSRPLDVVLDDIEEAVIGARWGANGYTTLAQADRLGDILELTSSKRLLDIGTGRGWPGLYLASKTGCELVLTDLPYEGLQIAALRVEEQDIRYLGAVVSSARHLPFTDDGFDAITHTDVLC